MWDTTYNITVSFDSMTSFNFNGIDNEWDVLQNSVRFDRMSKYWVVGLDRFHCASRGTIIKYITPDQYSWTFVIFQECSDKPEPDLEYERSQHIHISRFYVCISSSPSDYFEKFN